MIYFLPGGGAIAKCSLGALADLNLALIVVIIMNIIFMGRVAQDCSSFIGAQKV